jgi:hypothetical protein
MLDSLREFVDGLSYKVAPLGETPRPQFALIEKSNINT